MFTKDKKQIPEVKVKYFIGNSKKSYDYAIYVRSIGMFEVLINGKLGFANMEGKLVIPATFSPRLDNTGKLIPYNGRDGYIFVQENGLFGAIRDDGTLVLDYQWDDILYWKNHIVAVGQKVGSNTLWGFLDLQTGEVICKPQFNRLCLLEGDLIIVGVPYKKLYALYNLETRELLTQFKYDEYKPFVGSYAPVRLETKWGLIDKSGNEVIKPKYNNKFNFEGDFAIVEKNYYEKPIGSGNTTNLSIKSKKVLIDKDGVELVNSRDNKWTTIRRLSNNLFCLKGYENGKLITSLRQFIKYEDKSIIIKDAHYIYINYMASNGNLKRLYYEEITPESYQKSKKVILHLNYHNSHIYYIGEGSFIVNDKHSKKISLSSDESQYLKQYLTTKTEKILDSFGVKLEQLND